jgi:hypothetical protein
MATIEQLVAQGILAKCDLDLESHELPERLIYFLPRASEWIDNELNNVISDRMLEITPYEQVYSLIYDFVIGESLIIDRQVKHMKKLENHIWALKTPDVRIFGWFYKRDVFIGACADTAHRIKDSDLYHGYISEAIRQRNLLNLDPPKHIIGSVPHDVISNANYP